MSCVSGIHDRLTSSTVKRAISFAPQQLAMMLRWVSTTPFGSLVEPEENWMKAMSFGWRARMRPAREMSSSSSTRNVRTSNASNSFTRASLGRERADALERSSLGVQERVDELVRDAQQLVAMLIADAERHRHGNDPAEHRRPEGIDERLVV